MKKSQKGNGNRFSDADFVRAVEKARDHLARFERESPKNALLDVVVSVYLDSSHATFAYARDRIRDTFGDRYWQWPDAYDSGIDEKRISLIDGVVNHRNCIRIEVVDLGAGWNPKDGMIPKDTRGKSSAHVGVIYAAAQDPEWVRQMKPDQGVPYAIAGGYQLNVPGNDPWTYVPYVDFYRDSGRAELGARWYGHRYHEAALPLLWE